MTTGLIRRLQPRDLPMAAELFVTAYPARAEEVTTWPYDRAYVVVAGSPQRVVGYGAFWPVRRDRFRMDLVVAADQRRRGIGGRLLTHLVDQARTAGAATLQARVADDHADPLAFLLTRGFVETMRMYHQMLQVAEARLAPDADRQAQLARQGIVIETLDAEQRRVAGCWQRFCDLYNAARVDWPDPDPDPGPVEALTPQEFQHQHRAYEVAHGIGADQCFLARRANRYVGFTGAFGTAVHPAFRRQGIATALKIRAIAAARDHGIVTMRSSTGNPAMLRVNERLGFRTTSAELRLVRSL